MNVQFKKGVLDLCVLAMLNDSDRYGYELASTLSEIIMISDGTVYSSETCVRWPCGFISSGVTERTAAEILQPHSDGQDPSC